MDFWERHTLRKAAKISMHHAKTVLHMNRDLLEPMVVGDLESAIANVRAARRRGTGNEALREAITHVDRVAAYAQPKSKVSPLAREIVETLVVAFGVAMAFRAYFFQPFKIPTGSMQPTLYGIHSVAESGPENGPGLFDRQPLKPFKWIVTGEWYRDVVAESAGTVRVYENPRKVPGYILVNVAGKRHKIPTDAFTEITVPNARDMRKIGLPDDAARGERTLVVGQVKKGDRIWAGYVTAGDQVFVNRLAWNFFPPKRDDVIVFTTSRAELVFGETSKQTAPFPFRVNDVPIPRLDPGLHYIKRLVGMPGETISVEYPNVLVDGDPVKGLPGMDNVSERKEQYPGGPRYAGYAGTLDPGMGGGDSTDFLRTSADKRTLGDEYLPIGDNTFSSFDGRYWGPVPRNQMVGPGAIVYWPISRRWGRIR